MIKVSKIESLPGCKNQALHGDSLIHRIEQDLNLYVDTDSTQLVMMFGVQDGSKIGFAADWEDEDTEEVTFDQTDLLMWAGNQIHYGYGYKQLHCRFFVAFFTHLYPIESDLAVGSFKT